MTILLLLIQEEHLSVSGERNVHKVLVTCLLEACPGIVGLGELTVLK